MTNVGCDAGAIMSWTETNITVKMSPHKACVLCSETNRLTRIQTSEIAVTALSCNISFPNKPYLFEREKS